MPYRIEYMPVALEHLRRLSAHDQRIVVDTVEQQLEHQPDVPTRNRKPLRPNDHATWELRIGDLRIFYDALPATESEGESEEDDGSQPTVSILAVGSNEAAAYSSGTGRLSSEDEWFEYRLESDPRFLKGIEAARQSLSKGRGIRLEDLDES